MATGAMPVGDLASFDDRSAGRPATWAQSWRRFWMPLASLKLTVVLFAMAIFIIFVGTLAQVDQNMWEVIHEYFRSLFVWIELRVLFPHTWFPRLHKIPGWLGFPFPGGLLLGATLFANLTAVHLLRFEIQARGMRLAAGFAIILAGAWLTWLVVASGHDSEGLQGEPPIQPYTLWLWCKAALVVAWLASGVGLTRLAMRFRDRRLDIALVGSLCAVLGGTALWLLIPGRSFYLGDPAMRIMWQLLQGGLAGLVLLVGCVLVFQRRGGIVLLHGGIGLMMLGELLVGLDAIEERMSIEEGATANFAQDTRDVELAIVDHAYSATEDDVVVVARSRLVQNLDRPLWMRVCDLFRWLRGGNVDRSPTIQHALLPFDIQVLHYWKNTELADVRKDKPNLATAGVGLQVLAEPREGSGAADASGRIDVPSAYVRLSEKGGGQDLGTYLVSQWVPEFTQQVQVAGKTYDLSLRFKRNYKAYSMKLLDVRKVDYPGTTTPKDYSSDVLLTDPSRNVERQVRIWMNNPLRYAGETFYQSDYRKDERTGKETTTFQVVTNTGWMIPYVSCMLVAIGMLAHFLAVLVRFLQWRAEQGREPSAQGIIAAVAARVEREMNWGRRHGRRGREAEPTLLARRRWAEVLVPVAVVVICGGWLAKQAWPPQTRVGEMNLYEFGKLPVVYQGRAKPFDTLARNSLTIISDRDYVVDTDRREQPAIRWLLDVITQSEAHRRYPVFRIQNLDVLQTLGLERRPGFRYSVEEAAKNIMEFEKQVRRAREMRDGTQGIYERKIIELERRLQVYMMLTSAFRPLSFADLASAQAGKDKADRHLQEMQKLMLEAVEAEKELQRTEAPLAVPLAEDDAKEPKGSGWLHYATAWNRSYLRQLMLQKEPIPAAASLSALFDAYSRNDAATFNAELEKYNQWLAAHPPAQINLTKVRFESYFNHFAPLYVCTWLYLAGFVLAAMAWLGWSVPLNRAALWLMILLLLAHSFALVGRMYISGRPPVTNLYSSAVFIGWGCVLLGLILEGVFRLGLGNFVAAVAGCVTLLVAQFLALKGDTFTVMQAVLDTQFWLATHVVCIALGYSTTFIAGLLGMLYILLGVCTPSLTPDTGKSITRMTFGAVCFAIFFSFVGTVLGGLWADDSWGRFWGWDPKENGALIIVLWNALVLHARWGGMVKDRGLAILAVGGNIVTCWSWFGVNELGVGLHSYGFTEGVLPTLGAVASAHLLVIGLGQLPPHRWTSYREEPAVMPETVA